MVLRFAPSPEKYHSIIFQEKKRIAIEKLKLLRKMSERMAISPNKDTCKSWEPQGLINFVTFELSGAEKFIAKLTKIIEEEEMYGEMFLLMGYSQWVSFGLKPTEAAAADALRQKLSGTFDTTNSI